VAQTDCTATSNLDLLDLALELQQDGVGAHVAPFVALRLMAELAEFAALWDQRAAQEQAAVETVVVA